jgi:hypothetical protein
LETSTNGYGYVHEFSLKQLEQTTYNNEFYASLFLNEKITSLEKILLYFSERRIKPELHIDLRAWLYNSDLYTENEFIAIYTKKIVELIAKYDYQSYTFIGSSSKSALEELYRLDSSIRLFYETANVRGELTFLKNNFIYGVIAYNDRISKREIEFAHKNMIRVVLFNVKSQQSIVDAVEKHPDYIITDNIPKLQQVLY